MRTYLVNGFVRHYTNGVNGICYFLSKVFSLWHL